MYIVRKAYKEDFEDVFQLFKYFNNEKIDKAQWSRLFRPMCKELDNDFFGFVLEAKSDKTIVGYFGCILSLREINGRLYNICSYTSWVVKPEIRGKNISINLLEATFELKNYHFQALSPIKKTVHLYINNYGFKENIFKYYTLLPIPGFKSIFNKSLIVNNSNIKNHLSPSDCRLYDDHQIPNVFHIMYEYQKKYIYCIIKPTLYSSYVLNSSLIIRIFTKTWYKIFKKDFFKSKINLGLVHYTNNPAIFSESIHKFTPVICRELKVLGLSVNEKYLKRKSLFTFKNTLNFSGLYKSESLNHENFDTLYSELILLDLNHFQL